MFNVENLGTEKPQPLWQIFVVTFYLSYSLYPISDILCIYPHRATEVVIYVVIEQTVGAQKPAT